MDNKSDSKFNVTLNVKAILDKDFGYKMMKGYDPDQVDGFLDQIIKDYESFNAEIERLSVDNARLRARVDELTKQLSVSKNVSAATPQQQTASATNYDILKRLSNLERHVFGSKLSDNNKSDDTDDFGIDQY